MVVVAHTACLNRTIYPFLFVATTFKHTDHLLVALLGITFLLHTLLACAAFIHPWGRHRSARSYHILPFGIEIHERRYVRFPWLNVEWIRAVLLSVVEIFVGKSAEAVPELMYGDGKRDWFLRLRYGMNCRYHLLRIHPY